MDWFQFSIFFLSMIGMWLSSRADWRKTDQKIEEHRRETTSILRAIQDEIKDFHGRMERQDAEFKAHLRYHHKE